MRKSGMENGIHRLLQSDHDTGQDALEDELGAGKELEIDLRMDQGGAEMAEIGAGGSGGGGRGGGCAAGVVSGVVGIEDRDLEAHKLVVALRRDSCPGAEIQDSGGMGEDAIAMDDDAPSTPTGLTVVGGLDSTRGGGAAGGGGGPEMDRKYRVYKKGPWNVSEMLVLQSAKKEDVVRAGKGAPRDKHRTAQDKWQSIEDYCWAHFVQRSAQQCQDKWESMSAEFKKVKDCECGILSGQRSYWQMSMDERKAFRVPPNFQKEVYEGLWEWYDKNRMVEPGTISLSNVPKVEDSKVQSPVALGSSSPSGGAVSSRKRSIERTVTRVTRKIVQSDSMSGPTYLDPRALSQGEREAFDMFDLGDFVLREGATLRGAKLAYKVWGTLNEERSNAILYPSWFSGRHWENDWLIGPGMGLDPCKYFIIVPNMLGNGLSTSPSNCPAPYNKARFPKVRLEDNVKAQFKLVTEKFGIHQLKLVIGWSMAASQAFQWAVSFPDMVERILPFCGTARTSPHHFVFLEGVKAALTADSSFQDGWYEKTPSKGLRAVARICAGWGFSQAFYWTEVWREMGYSSLEDFLIGFWEGFFFDRRDPNNLLNMLWTWQNSNIGMTDGCDGSVEKALGLIRAKAIVMPAAQDLYFPVADEEYEVKFMQNAELRVIPGVWGQFAGAGLNSHDTKFIDKAVCDLLAM